MRRAFPIVRRVCVSLRRSGAVPAAARARTGRLVPLEGGRADAVCSPERCLFHVLVPGAVEYWRYQRPRRIRSALSHSGSCTRSMKRHLSPQLRHKTDLPSGSERPLAVRLNSLTSDRWSVCWQALMRRLSTPGGRVTLRRRRQRCVEVGAALWTEVEFPRDSI